MKTLALTLAALAVGASLSTAFADQPSPEGRLVPVAQAIHGGTAPVIEGRQATPVAISASSALNGADRFVIDRNQPEN